MMLITQPHLEWFRLADCPLRKAKMKEKTKINEGKVAAIGRAMDDDTTAVLSCRLTFIMLLIALLWT